MSYVAYKLIHYLGIFTMVTSLTAMCFDKIRGGTHMENPHRKPLGAAHGVAALLILFGGFGMLARLGVLSDGVPGWAIAKIAIWLTLSAAVAIPYIGRTMALLLLLAVPLLAVAAGATALYKPF